MRKRLFPDSLPLLGDDRTIAVIMLGRRLGGDIANSLMIVLLQLLKLGRLILILVILVGLLLLTLVDKVALLLLML